MDCLLVSCGCYCVTRGCVWTTDVLRVCAAHVLLVWIARVSLVVVTVPWVGVDH